MYSCIGSLVDAHEKIIPKRDRRDTTNPRPQDLLCLFLCDQFLTSFFQNNLLNNVWTKVDTADLDLPRQILLCRGLRSFWGALVRMGFICFKEAKLVCAWSIIEYSHVPAIASTKQQFLRNIKIRRHKLDLRAQYTYDSSDSIKTLILRKLDLNSKFVTAPPCPTDEQPSCISSWPIEQFLISGKIEDGTVENNIKLSYLSTFVAVDRFLAKTCGFKTRSKRVFAEELHNQIWMCFYPKRQILKNECLKMKGFLREM